jgi:hypothetical protein
MSASIFAWQSFLHVCISAYKFLSSYKDTSHWFRAHPDPG